MEIRIFENKEALNRAAAKYFIEVINDKKKPVLGLATGSSPIGMYEKLIESYQKGAIDFSNVVTYNLDEYCGLDKTHEQSYYQFMQENLFSHVNMNEKNINIPSGEGSEEDLQKACDEYNLKLRENEIDIQILGIGSNGHIAFNEPGTPFGTKTHCVELDQNTREDNARFFNSLDEVPKHAITMGLANIMKSKKIILIATGANKADAVRRMIQGDVTEQMPASILQFHPNVVVLTDREAAQEFIK